MSGKTILSIGIASLLLFSPAYAVEKGSYRTLLKRSGEVLWQASWTVGTVQENGREIVRFEEEGSGRYNASPEDIRWTVQASYIDQDPPLVLETRRVARGADNTVLWERHKIFDRVKGRLIAEQFQHGKLKEREVECMPSGRIYTSETLPMLLRGLDFKAREPAVFYTFSSDGDLRKVRAYVRGVETIRVPAGVFECYKVELRLDLGPATLLAKAFVPKTFMWFTVAPPHHWVKFEGLERGLGSPYVAMELVDKQDQ